MTDLKLEVGKFYIDTCEDTIEIVKKINDDLFIGYWDNLFFKFTQSGQVIGNGDSLDRETYRRHRADEYLEEYIRNEL